MAVTAMAVVGFASCNKDDNMGGKNPGEGKEAVLKVTLKTPTARSTRFAGTATAADNTEIKNFSVFVIGGDGYIWKGHFDVSTQTVTGDGTQLDVSGNDPVGTMDVTTDAQKVYVIANAGDQTGNYSTQADLESESVTKLINLSTQYTDPWATGIVGTLNFRFVNGVQTANATATPTFIASRITVTVDNRMENYGNPNTVVLNDVAVMNARGQSKLFPGAGSRLIPTTYGANRKFYEGVPNGTSPVFQYYPAVGTFTPDTDKLVEEYTHVMSPQTSAYYFYVFENDALAENTFPTIITIVGTHSNGIDKTYFPVHLAPYEVWASDSGAAPFTTDGGLLRGKSYDITITLTGNAAIDGGGGVDDPTVNVENAVVLVTISINDWVPVLLHKVL